MVRRLGAERAARLHPDDGDLERRAARVRKAYVELDDLARRIGVEEIANEVAAPGVYERHA